MKVSTTMARRPRRPGVNGPTPSEFSFGRGTRPSMELYPQPDMDFDVLAYKRAVMQVDPSDPAAPIDFRGEYQGVDEFGREIPNMRDRGYTPIVREVGRGEADILVDGSNPKAYEDEYGKGADPNENWRNAETSDPLRRGWENGNWDEDVVKETAQYKEGHNKQLSDATKVRDKGKRLKIKRTPDAMDNGQLKHDGYHDPRADGMPWL